MSPVAWSTDHAHSDVVCCAFFEPVYGITALFVDVRLLELQRRKSAAAQFDLTMRQRFVSINVAIGSNDKCDFFFQIIGEHVVKVFLFGAAWFQLERCRKGNRDMLNAIYLY